MSRILVVDDEKSIRITVSEFLKEARYSVEIAKDADEALEILSSQKIDVVVSDIILPGINGIDLLKSVCKISPNVQVILMTGEPNVETASEAVRMGAFDYLIKPITKEKITRIVSQAVKVKDIDDERIRLEKENKEYQKNLEKLVQERTKSLMESEKLNKSITQSANDAIISINSDGIILLWNNAAENFFGYSAEEMLNSQLIKILPNHFKVGHESGIARLKNDVKEKLVGKTVEVTALRKDGSQFPVELSLSSWLSEGKKHYTGIIRDISARKESEREMLESKKKAENADKMKSIFLAQMSHEIRTPINALVSISSLLRYDFEEGADEDQLMSFDIIDRAGGRIIRTVDLLLNLAEIQAGTYDVSLTKFDVISDVISIVMAEYKKTAKKKNLQLSLERGLIDTELVADSYTVNQIFTQLIDNAIKYTEEGEVIIKVARNESEQLVVEIKDSGIGIEEEYLPNLFKPFSQEQMGYTRKFEGNGIGMALVQKYCELNNATIEVESEKGIGSIFRVIFEKDENDKKQ